jgi:hypothetical protein
MSNDHCKNGCRESREKGAERDNEDLQSIGRFLVERCPMPGSIDS